MTGCVADFTIWSGTSPFIERGEAGNDLVGFEGDSRHAFEEIDDVSWVVVFLAPVIGVVLDAGGFLFSTGTSAIQKGPGIDP